MSGVLLFDEITNRTQVIAFALLSEMFKEAEMELPEISDLSTYAPGFAPEGPVIVFGSEAWLAVTGEDVGQSFGKVRGWSKWIDDRRYVLTYRPEYVVEKPDLYFDFYYDTILPIKYPMKTPPRVDIENIMVPGTTEALGLVLKYMDKHPGTYALDIETAGFRPMRDRILCISISPTTDRSLVLTPKCWGDPNLLRLVRDILTHPNVKWVCHNGKFDIRFIRHQLGVVPHLTDDTMLLHYILDERIGTHGLKDLCSTRLALPDYEAELRSHLRRKADSFDTIPPKILYKYAGMDTAFTLRLFHALLRELDDHPHRADLKRAYSFLMEASNALGDIETHGFVIDLEALNAASDHLGQECDNYLVQLNQLVGYDINPRSPKQVAEYLYDKMKYQEVKLFRNHKPRSTSSEALKKLRALYPKDEFLTTLLAYRETSKILSTYVEAFKDAIDPDGRLRADFKLHGTVTGRLACSSPNLQNIPRPAKNKSARLIRNMFTVDKGMVIVGADYSQAELRVAAIKAQEERMREVWESGVDFHTQTCVDLFGENWKPEDRMIAKMLNFGVVYGRTAGSIAVERGISINAAVAIMDKFFQTKPRLARWLKETREEALRNGYLKTEVGRMRRFGLITPQNQWRALNQAANFKISSLASDCCLRAAIDMHNWCKQTNKGRVLLLVHDSIYVECRKEDADEIGNKLTELMEAAGVYLLGTDWIILKTDVHAAERWGEL